MAKAKIPIKNPNDEVTISTINGKKYYYIRDTLYINKGVAKVTTSSLGRVETTTPEMLVVRKEKSKQLLTEREINLRVDYWKEKASHKAVYLADTVRKLETLRSKLYRAKQDLGVHGNSALEHAFLIDFIYNSNKIEGSRLPKEEVKRLLEDNKNRNNEVINTIKAKAFLQERFKFEVKSLVEMHKILLAHEPAKHGIRKTTIMVGEDASLCDPANIEEQLNRLFAWFHDQENKLYPLELAFLFYYKFERIHPFPDGNGRMGRLLMNEILKRSKYHPIIIWNKKRAAHFNAFKRGTQGTLMPFLRFMNEQYAKTHKMYLEKIGPANDFEEKVQFFMSPSEE
jgi:Fic family protein